MAPLITPVCPFYGAFTKMSSTVVPDKVPTVHTPDDDRPRQKVAATGDRITWFAAIINIAVTSVRNGRDLCVRFVHKTVQQTRIWQRSDVTRSKRPLSAVVFGRKSPTDWRILTNRHCSFGRLDSRKVLRNEKPFIAHYLIFQTILFFLSTGFVFTAF